MTWRSESERLERAETEVEGLLFNARDQVQRLQSTIDRMRALRAYGRFDSDHTWMDLGDPGGRQKPSQLRVDPPA